MGCHNGQYYTIGLVNVYDTKNWAVPTYQPGYCKRLDGNVRALNWGCCLFPGVTVKAAQLSTGQAGSQFPGRLFGDNFG